ncbi:adenylosuccinate lyase [Maribacter sp. CXY002]|uniref:adenylosuccinate lyase n=1 Tax=Maribacter luteocoastalis TaxID=3407671 RepID=UPI003B66B7A7
MQVDELYQALNYVDHSRKKRKEMARLAKNNPYLMGPLLHIAFRVNDPISSKACWVLEFTAKEDLTYLFPWLSIFTEKLQDFHLEPSVRPIAKICEYLAISYFKSKNPKTIKALTDVHLERMATACFDWLIGNYKVAPKAYSMTSLFLIGHKFDWILPELKMVLEQNYHSSSAAYKARARMVLAKLQ